jgi:FKBP-type peptidyl-prolyl cis-trans isomerase
MLVCPSDIAYGDQGRPSIPGGATLIFDIELLDIVAPK